MERRVGTKRESERARATLETNGWDQEEDETICGTSRSRNFRTFTAFPLPRK